MALKYSTKQKEQPGKPLIDVPMDTTGRLANDYVDLLDTIREHNEKLDVAGAELIDALKKQGRNEISVRGIVLKVKEIEAKIKISVKRPKED